MLKFTKKFYCKVPTWEDILDNFNQSVLNKKLIKHSSLGFFVSHDANKLKEVKKVLKKLKLKEAHLYLNICVSETFGRHKDSMDVYFWQIQGSTRWEFDNINYVLAPGDLIYVPKETYHNVVPLGPRAGISMSL
jgi:mannose-6-phosphate isomerase-like protein (cupin superfamily)